MCAPLFASVPSFTDYLNSGHAWLFIPFAIIMGALHGMEPGHSKTMMAAFIIAIRGTVTQAVLLGLAATFSHTAIIWALAAIGLHYSNSINVEGLDPYFQLGTGIIVIGMSYWIYRRSRAEDLERIRHERAHELGIPHSHGHDHSHEHEHDHDHSHDHDHHHDSEHGHTHSHTRDHTHEPGGLIILPGSSVSAPAPRVGSHGGTLLDTGHGWLEIAVSDAGVLPHLRVYPCRASGETVPIPRGTTVSVEAARLDGSSQKFSFEPKDRYWEATAPLPEPHDFLAIVKMSHGDHSHTYRLNFSAHPAAAGLVLPSGESISTLRAHSHEHEHGHEHEHSHAHGHSHGDEGFHVHSHADLTGLDPHSVEYQDAHERAHAEDLRDRFSNRQVTTWQIILFGLTGGLMPCPAAFTILFVCLQLKRFTLGMTLVLCFSIGLALTLVSVGAIAALSLKYASKRFKGFGKYARFMPYASSLLMTLIGFVIIIEGVWGLVH